MIISHLDQMQSIQEVKSMGSRNQVFQFIFFSRIHFGARLIPSDQQNAMEEEMSKKSKITMITKFTFILHILSLIKIQWVCRMRYN